MMGVPLRILVIGSEGFIGKHSVRHLLAAGREVHGADLFEQPSFNYPYRKLSRLSPEWDELLQQKRFEAVLNAAGSGNVPYSMTHPVIDFEANSLDTIRILDGIRKHQPECRYLHLSSAAVYGNPVRLPIQENDELKPLSPYGWHKVVAEKLCQEYTQVFGLRTAVVRPFSVYGSGLKKQMFWDLYQRTREADHVTLFGTGQESRDYIHVADLALALDRVISDAPMEGECYNLASGEETTIADVIKPYFRAIGYQGTYDFNGVVRPGDPLNWKADISRIGGLGHVNALTLDQGMDELGRWLKEL